MTEPKKDQELPVIDPKGPACMHLRNKEMYVFNDMVDEVHGEHEATNFWCLKTMKGFGPDDQIVGRLSCRDNSRECFEAL
jgi:hypothetical protein